MSVAHAPNESGTVKGICAMTSNTSSDDSVFASADRRLFLKRGLQLGGAALLGGPLLAACGSSGSSSASASSSSSSGAKSFGELTLRLSWIKNVEFAGSYIADTKGYYTAEGFSKATLIGGGPTATPMETDVVTKKALVAISSPDITGAAVAKGAPLKIIGAQYQKNPFCIMSMAKTPITKPEDLYGKKIGVQASNESVWAAFVKAAGLDASNITKVPVQFDPLPLTQGTVDGWFSFVTNEPNSLRLKGFQVATMLLADAGYPLVSETYCVRQDTIDKQRDLLKAFLRAEIKGWKDSIADPTLGAKLAATQYGKGLGLTTSEQTLESKGQNLLMVSAGTRKSGLFTVTDELIAENIKTLKFGGLDLTAAQLFDFSLLEEVYKEDPSLI
jgi:ABC-type nitrate/sulfonate/bicarbonate transport system substrate-binding protein